MKIKTIIALSVSVVLCLMLSVTTACTPHMAQAQEHPVSMSQQRWFADHLREMGVSVLSYGQTQHLIIPSELLFNHSSANFNDHHLALLYALVDYLNGYEMIRLQIHAYTDSLIPRKMRGPLTRRQADVLQHALLDHGLDAARLVVSEGFGAKSPVASNRSALGRSINRRVEIGFTYRSVTPKSQQRQ